MNYENREIRVFISSTFRDMMRERDLLVKEVFPELRRKCAQRFVTFTEVDLRWGITEEQSAEGQVLPLCLAEIERSRPYFIGLLGERYGWIPETIPPELIKREAWLSDHVHGRKSVTELEILHGVLNNPYMADHAFFYFRDPAYAADPSLSEEDRRELSERNINAEVEQFGNEDATRRTEERKGKLADLKHRIRESGLPFTEPYDNPGALADGVRAQFDELIDLLYPEEDVPDPLTQERLAHEAHAKNKLFACIDRPKAMAVLYEFAMAGEHGGQGLVLTGESGCGKTALLASWAQKWKAEHPDDFLFQHYFGATPGSATPEGFLRRLMGELKARYEIADEILADPEKLRDALLVWLAQTAGQGRVVLVLDGLNQLQGSEADRRLRFLPRCFPPHVTVIASTLEGLALGELGERGWQRRDLPLASAEEVDAMVAEYFRIHGRHVDAEGRPMETALRRDLVAAAGSKNPLFLRTVLEELRQFGSFEDLPARVRHYLEADNPKDLFLRVIARWQEDFDRRGSDRDEKAPDLTRRVLTHLLAAREGLSEPEWLDLLGDGAHPLPRALWAPLFLALEPHLTQRLGGLYTFGHDFLRQATEKEFASTQNQLRAAHLAVADYFEDHPHQREMTPRKAAEWPFQLHAAETWDHLEICLTDLQLFMALCTEETQWELTKYWHPLRQRGSNMGAAYTEAFSIWLQDPNNTASDIVASKLGTFLLENGLHRDASTFVHGTLKAREERLGAEHPETLASVNNLAALLTQKGDCVGAEQMFRRAFEGYKKLLGPDHLTTLGIQGNLARSMEDNGNYAMAEQLYRQALDISTRNFGHEHDRTLTLSNNLGFLLMRRGDYAGAESLLQEVLQARRRNLGPAHPDTLTSMNNLALSLSEKGDDSTAKSLHQQALEISERILGPEHPYTLISLSNTAELLMREGNYAEAEKVFRRTLEMRQKVLGRDHRQTQTCLTKLAELLKRKGDYGRAEPLFREAMATSTRVLGAEHPDTRISLSNWASLLTKIGDYHRAEPILRDSLEWSERFFGHEHPNTATAMSNLAFVLMTKGDITGAESLTRQALKLREKVRGCEHPETLTSQTDLIRLLQQRGNYEEAEFHSQRVLEIGVRVLGPQHPISLASLNNLATIRKSKGDFAGAGRLLRKALQDNQRLLGEDHPITLASLRNLASLHRTTGDYANAALLQRRALDVLERTFGPEHPDTLTCKNDLASVLVRQGDFAGAEHLFRETLAARERVLGAEHPDTLTSVHDLAFFFGSRGDQEEAYPLWLRAMQTRKRILGPKHPDTLTSTSSLAACLISKGDVEAAEPLYRETLRASEEILGPNHLDTLVCVRGLATALERKGDYTGAESLFRRAIVASEQIVGSEHHDTMMSVRGLASVLDSKGDYAEAEPLYRRALNTAERIFGPVHPTTLLIVRGLAGCLAKMRSCAEAAPLFRRLLEETLRATERTGSVHRDLEVDIANYGGCLNALGQSDATIRSELDDLLKCFGITTHVGSGDENTDATPPPEIQEVIAQIHRNPSDIAEILARLQDESPQLYLALQQWVQNHSK